MLKPISSQATNFQSSSPPKPSYGGLSSGHSVSPKALLREPSLAKAVEDEFNTHDQLEAEGALLFQPLDGLKDDYFSLPNAEKIAPKNPFSLAEIGNTATAATVEDKDSSSEEWEKVSGVSSLRTPEPRTSDLQNLGLFGDHVSSGGISATTSLRGSLHEHESGDDTSIPSSPQRITLGRHPDDAVSTQVIFNPHPMLNTPPPRNVDELSEATIEEEDLESEEGASNTAVSRPGTPS